MVCLHKYKQHGTCYFLIILILFHCFYTIRTCTPPYVKKGSTTIKLTSLSQRLNKAKTVIIGTVIEIYTDQYRKVKARVAVHMKLKGESVNSIIAIEGFGAYSSNNLFYSQVSDCTDTNVNLYGTYIFTIQKANSKDYKVDEIDFQPAVTELKCRKRIQSKFRRALNKYRKLKKNKIQCHDQLNSQVTFSRKCLKTKNLQKLLDNYMYKKQNPRKIYCALKKIKRKIVINTKKVSPESTMHDQIIIRTQIQRDYIKKKNKTSVKNKSWINNATKKSSKLKKQNNINNNYKNGESFNIIFYTQNHKYVIRNKNKNNKELLITTTSNTKTSQNQQKTNIQIKNSSNNKKWRLVQLNENMKSSSINLLYLHKSIIVITLFVYYLLY